MHLALKLAEKVGVIRALCQQLLKLPGYFLPQGYLPEWGNQNNYFPSETVPLSKP